MSSGNAQLEALKQKIRDAEEKEKQAKLDMEKVCY